jgi:hypothetical protein
VLFLVNQRSGQRKGGEYRYARCALQAVRL